MKGSQSESNLTGNTRAHSCIKWSVRSQIEAVPLIAIVGNFGAEEAMITAFVNEAEHDSIRSPPFGGLINVSSGAIFVVYIEYFYPCHL